MSLTASAAWIALSSEVSPREPIGWLAIVGIVLWVVGFTFEVTADVQKSAFKANPKNKGTFIHTGLWSRSRHPNYFGEIVLWIVAKKTAEGKTRKEILRCLKRYISRSLFRKLDNQTA